MKNRLERLRASAHTSIRHILVLTMIATSLAAMALVASSSAAKADDVRTMCSGETVDGRSGDGVKNEIFVPGNARLRVDVTASIEVPRVIFGFEYWDYYVAVTDGPYEDQHFITGLIWGDNQHGPASSSRSIEWDPDSSDRTVHLNVDVWQAPRTSYSMTVTIIDVDAPACTQAFRHGVTRGGRNASEPCVKTCSVGQPVSVQSGNFFHSFRDLSFGGRGPTLALERTYNSVDGFVDSPFGYGWQSSVTMTVSEATVSGTNVATVRQENGSLVEFKDLSSGLTPQKGTDATLAKDSSGWTFVRRNLDVFHFNTSGQLLDHSDRNGNTVSFTYTSGRLSGATNASGHTIVFGWNTAGTKITSATDTSSAPNRVVTYAYNVHDELESVIDPVGDKWSFGYGAGIEARRMTTMKSPRHQTGPTIQLLTQYDGSGRVIKQTDRLGKFKTFSYSGTTTTVTDEVGNVTKYNYAHGLLQSRVDGFGSADQATTSYEYDPATLGVTKVVDGRGKQWRYAYDAAFNQTWAKDPEDREMEATFNSFHQPLTVTDGEEVTTTYEYETGTPNLKSVSTPLVGSSPPVAQKTQFGHDTSHPGDVTSVVDPRGKTTTIHFDAAGNPDRVTDAEGHTTVASFNTLGLPDWVVSPRGNLTSTPNTQFKTSFTYNKRGQLLSATDPLGHSVSREYDANGNLWKSTNADLHVTTFTYDNENRLKTTTRADNSSSKPSILENEYWPDGRLWKQIDGKTKATVYTYDPLGRVKSTTDPDGRVTTLGYDLSSNLKTVSNALGVTTRNFDDANQLESVVYDDNKTPNITGVGYDDNGRLTSISQIGGNNSSREYDSLGRLIKSNDSTGDVAYGYDLANNLTSITYPGNKTVTRDFDDANRMTSSTDWLGNATEFDFNEDNGLKSTDFEGDQIDSYDIDRAGRLMGSAATNGATNLMTLAYTRKDSGLLKSETADGLAGTSSRSWEYDAIDQLTKENDLPVWTYDLADHLTKLANGQTQSFSDSGALCSTGPLQSTTCAAPTNSATTYGYNGVGSRTSMTPAVGTATNYEYDQAQRLIGVSPGDYHSATPGGFDHTLSVRSDGTVIAFGLNANGQLGDGTTVDKHTPITVPDIDHVRAASAGLWHSVAVDTTGHIWTWGRNSDGELGDGTNTERHTPTKLTGISNVAAVSAGWGTTVALTADGHVWTWGLNNFGQLGDSGTTSRNTPYQVPNLDGVVAIASGQATTYALKGNGTVWAWGSDAYGQLGNNAALASSSTPVQVDGITNATAISAGQIHAYALVGTGTTATIKAWGYNLTGALGDGTGGDPANPWKATPVDVYGITGAKRVSAGGFHGLVLLATGTVAAWGDNSSGQIGDTTNINRLTPVTLSTLSNISAIDAQPLTSSATESDGTLHTWGSNGFGQLGDGTTTDRNTPVQPLDGTGPTGSSTPAGFFHTLAVRADGTIAAAGQNTNGQLGDGTTTDRTRPVTVNALNSIGITDAATGLWHSAALDTQGRVYTWGKNDTGQLGDNSTTDRRLPARVYGIPTATAIAAGLGHTIALASDGTVWTWGLNTNGQLGDGTTTDRARPVHVSGLTGVTAVAAGQSSSYALKSDGTVWAWGNNTNGQLGNGTTYGDDEPTQVDVTNVTQIAAGQVHAYALRANGTIAAWGYNANGQLGHGTDPQEETPVTVDTITTAVDVAAGGYHGVAALANGSVTSWGDGTFGQLGAGTTTTGSNTPVTISSLAAIVGVDAGALNTSAVDNNGTLYTWGYNSNGQLGDGTNTTRFDPVHPTGMLDLNNIPLTSTYKYAADGLRTSKTVGGDTTSFVWNRTSNIAGLLTETSGGQTTSYVYGPDGLPYETVGPDGTVTYLHHDQLGSTRLATSESGAIVGSATYDPWGNTITMSGDMPNLGWAGEYRDRETGFTYLRARYYDPATTQFLTRDPLEAVTGTAYGYAFNSPTNLTDPSGLSPLDGLVGGFNRFMIGDACSDGFLGSLGRTFSGLRDSVGMLGWGDVADWMSTASRITGAIGSVAPLAIILFGPQAVPFFVTLAIGATLFSMGELIAGAAANDDSHVQAGAVGTALGGLSLVSWGAVGSNAVPASTATQAFVSFWSSTVRWFMQEVIGHNV